MMLLREGKILHPEAGRLNGLPILREPRTTTGKRTMLYMALSLAFIAGGILIAYLLAGVEPKAGKTLNAVLFENLTANWSIAGVSISMPIVTMTLLTEGALLFVAAQTGFVGGPQVLATMALDRWVPRRFSNLSERLVTQDGVLAMGMAALLSAARHSRASPRVGNPVCDQCLRHLHALAARNERVVVARKKSRAAIVAQVSDQRRRLRIYRADPDPDRNA